MRRKESKDEIPIQDSIGRKLEFTEGEILKCMKK